MAAGKHFVQTKPFVFALQCQTDNNNLVKSVWWHKVWFLSEISTNIRQDAIGEFAKMANFCRCI